MKIFAHDPRAAQLGRYWNALAGGASGAELERLGAGIDPQLRADIDLMRRGHDRQIPDRRFVARLEHDVMRALPVPGAPSPSPSSFVPLATSGPVPDPSRVGWPPYPARAGRRRQAGAWTAAVIALLVVLAGITMISDGRTPESLPFRAADEIGTTATATAAPSTPALAGMNGIAEPLWTAPTSGPGAVKNPGYPNVDAAGNVWVSDGMSNVFVIYTADGAFLETWGGTGSGPGQFVFSPASPDLGDVAFAADGGFYVADPGNRRIQRFDADRRFLVAWGDAGDGAGDGQLRKPASVTIAPDGTILVSDYDRNDVQRFAADGTYLDRFDFGPSPDDAIRGASGVTIAPDGTIWVTGVSDNRIHRFDAAGEKLGTIGESGTGPGQFREPWEVAFDAAGNAHVVDLGNHRVQVFSLDGTYVAEWGSYGFSAQPGQFNGPGAITIAGDIAYVTQAKPIQAQAFRLILPIVPMATPTPAGATPGP